MLKRLVSILLLILILANSLNMAVLAAPSLAQDTLSIASQEASRLTQSVAPSDADGHEHGLGDPKSDGVAKNVASAGSGQFLSDKEDNWNLSTSSEWAKLAYGDGNNTRLIIGLDDPSTATMHKLEQSAAGHQGSIIDKVRMGGQVKAVVVELPLSSVPSFVEAVRRLGLASYIEPNMRVQTSMIPNDPLWSMQWGPRKIQADWAWNATVGDSSVLVAVVDTGIYYTHPDIAPNYASLGYDWANNDPDPLDDHGHGTHCAGIIAAVLNNSVGIAGLAQVRVMAEKVLNSWGYGYWDWVANGIINATECGADIISMSLGGYGDSELVHDAVKYAYDSGVLVIAAAGNDNTNTKSYPAAYEEVVAVAATDQYDDTAWFSNWGEWIELAAPGVDIHSTVPWGYESWSGTSMACPHVSGLAALVWSRHLTRTRDWVRLWLRYAADDLGDPGFDVYYGYGRINARKAVEQNPPAHELIAHNLETPPFVEPNGSAVVNASVLNFGDTNETDVTAQLYANETLVASTSISLLPAGDSVTFSLAWNPTLEGSYNVTVYVAPVDGETSVDNNVLSKTLSVGTPVKAFVLHSSGNTLAEAITNWQVLSSEWSQFGETMIYVDYETLNEAYISYEDLAASGADVLIVSCAYDPSAGWQFTDQEIEAIERYVHEGHGLIATAGTLYYGAPNNNKLAPLFGLNETVEWDATYTDLLHLTNTTHPISCDIPNPLIFPEVGTALPSDRRWDSNELAGGKYLALGHFQESAVVTYRGLVYISPWLEIIPPYYHHHLHLLYNAIVWSQYQKPQHDLSAALTCPLHADPGNSIVLNATVTNMGLNNETNVNLTLSIDAAEVANLTVPQLAVGESATLSYVWTPPAGTYNVTAFTPPVPGEDELVNNVHTVYSRISYAAVIGFVETHGESLHSDDLKSFYESLGHIVYTIRSTLTPELLADFDLLIVGEDWSNTVWTSVEMAAVRGFINSGGGFAGIGDELADSVRQILEDHGIAYTGYYGNAGSSDNLDHSHPLMLGVNTIFSSNPVNSLETESPAYWIANDTYNEYTLIGGAEASGAVLCMSDDFALNMNGDDNEVMFTNMVDWMATIYEHDLAVRLEAPPFLIPSTSVQVNATVRNRGVHNETDVKLQILINDTEANSAYASVLLPGASFTLSIEWNPTVEGTYNITAYSTPVSGEAKTSNNVATALTRVRATIASVAVLNSMEEPPYFTGGWSNNYQVLIDALNARGFHAQAITNDDIMNGVLSSFDVFVMVDNVPSEVAVPYVVSFWHDGGGLVAFDSSICFLCYAGVLPPESSGSNGYFGYWDYGTVSQAEISVEHPVTAGYVVGQVISGTAGDAEYWVDALSGTSAYPYYTMLAEDLSRENRAYVSAYEPPTAGKVVHIWDALHWQNGGIQLMILNALEWAPAPRYDHDLGVWLEVPSFVKAGESVILNATVRNLGLYNETDVELQLIINDTTVDSLDIPVLLTGAASTLSYNWTSPPLGIYNVTAFAGPVSGEERTANNVATRSAKVASVTFVLFDQTHGTDAISYYSIWVTSLISRNCIVETHNSGPITPSVLGPYDVFVIPQAHSSYTTGELAAIQDFVYGGGGLLVIGDDSTPFYTDLTGFAGITWTAGGAGGLTTNITPHPVTVEVEEVYLFGPIAQLDVSGTAQDLVRDHAGNIMLAVSEPSGGKVLAFVDEDTLWDYGIVEADNLMLANNMIDWLPGPSLVHDVAITGISLSSSQVLQGDTLTANVTATNEGDEPESFNVTAYASPANSTRVYVDPADYVFNASTVSIGHRFNVSVWINSTEPFSVCMWQVYLSYDDSLINATQAWSNTTREWEIRGWPSEYFGGRNWNTEYIFYGQTGGAIGSPVYMPAHTSPISLSGVMIGDILFNDINATGAPKRLCTIEFEIKALPEEGAQMSCVLGVDNDQTFVYNMIEGEIPTVKFNGHYAIYSGVPPPPPPPEAHVIGTTAVVGLDPGENVTLSFFWNTSGIVPHDYVIWAEASKVPRELHTSDNIYYDGTVKVTKYPIASFVYSPLSPRPGETVTFNASASTPDGGTIVSYQWDFGDGNITTTPDPMVTHAYAVGDIYNATLTVVDSDGLNDSTWRLVCVLTRDIAVLDIAPSTNQTYNGRTITVNVTVANQGEIPETFNVTLYYNATAIGTQTVNVSAGASMTLAFSWNTSGTVPNADYVLSAEASAVPFESDFADNILTDGTVRVKLVGDVNGDGKVSMLDLYLVAISFGSSAGHASWNPEADLNDDGMVNMVDLYLVASNFGKT